MTRLASLALLVSGAVLLLNASLPAGAQQTSPPPLKDGGTVAFLGLTFLDTSTEGAINGVREDETRRTLMLQDMVRSRFEQEGLTLSDLSPIAEELERTVNPSNCYGCEVRMAAKIKADYVVTGLVQKVSNLILSMNLVMREVPSGKIVRARSVEIRSNTDDSWQRGMRYILKNAFFKT
ncbi:DUF3280 domain-containing protein [Roseibium litorale]|uniref:DUF3280 domain-containing protein n=1 Tax=Roseibium litorale TaxID=2803841 RepID=A0ABR9CK42_9HYPH|nr:DUF3280 domain-containing protein [Roseibium litorale]MBD8891024.1 DUF3280 domain-containing protein [Roseibium litorale]